MAKAKADIRSLARAHTAAAISTLAGIMRQPKAPAAARVSAASALLDRGWGKPTQPLSNDGDDPLRIQLIERLIVDPAATESSE